MRCVRDADKQDKSVWLHELWFPGVAREQGRGREHVAIRHRSGSGHHGWTGFGAGFIHVQDT